LEEIDFAPYHQGVVHLELIVTMVSIAITLPELLIRAYSTSFLHSQLALRYVEFDEFLPQKTKLVPICGGCSLQDPASEVYQQKAYHQIIEMWAKFISRWDVILI